MEIPNSKQQQLTFEKGITNVPSDAICSDNTLAESVGLTFENGEHRPIQLPTVFASTIGRVLFIHRNGTLSRYILIINATGHDELVWGINTNDNIDLDPQATIHGTANIMDIDKGAVPQITALGKTLIVRLDSSVRYFLWKDDGYSELSDIPMPDIEFRLTDFRGGEDNDWRDAVVDPSASIEEIVDHGDVMDGQQSAWNDVVVGLYSQNKRWAEEKNRFICPFFVRAAVRMYDGTYTKMTPPILMVPAMTENSYSKLTRWRLNIYTYSCLMEYRLRNSYTAYSDIVSDVVIFVSSQIETLKVIGDQPSMNSIFVDQKRWTIKGISLASDSSLIKRIEKNLIETYFNELYNYVPFPITRSMSDIKRDIEETSVFYKLAEIGLSSTGEWKNIADVAPEHTLENLTTQDQLTDEFHGHTSLSAGYAYVYNNRLNLANVSRTLFNGFSRFMPYDNFSDSDALVTHRYDAYVDIKTDAKKMTVHLSYVTSERQGIWFYYPDARANHVSIFRTEADSSVCILNADLKEHKGLNGAYYFRGLPVDADYEESMASSITQPSDIPDTQIEELAGTLVTSEVNNPFTFLASGYNQVSFGSIVAVAVNTQAISQGQFGQHELFILSDSGIWALTLDGTGLFVKAAPFSRDVCNNPLSVVQTDAAVFFSSERGLMCIASGQVACVSQQLTTLTDFLRSAFIAYDYRDSLLWIFRKDSDICYVYNIKSSTIGSFIVDSCLPEPTVHDETLGYSYTVGNVVNAYPDTLIQTIKRQYNGDEPYSSTNLLSLLNRPSDYKDDNIYSASFITRPMKLENAFALKRLIQILHVAQMQGSISLRIFASNNLSQSDDSWVELHSLLGIPWKYYRLQYSFSNLRATDRFAGSVLVTEEVRTDKLR